MFYRSGRNIQLCEAKERLFRLPSTVPPLAIWTAVTPNPVLYFNTCHSSDMDQHLMRWKESRRRGFWTIHVEKETGCVWPRGWWAALTSPLLHSKILIVLLTFGKGEDLPLCSKIKELSRKVSSSSSNRKNNSNFGGNWGFKWFISSAIFILFTV